MTRSRDNSHTTGITSTGCPGNVHPLSTPPPPSYKVDQGWRKGGLRVDKGWRTLKLYGEFLGIIPGFLSD